MIEKQIEHIMETHHRKAMREPAKRLRAAIEQASKKRCWYNGWKHEGDRANYGILYEPMREFLSEAQFSDICAMCDFLLAKANKQIEISDDDGDCAGQARYWMEKMLKALLKCDGGLAEKIGWLEDFQKRDVYFLADYAKTMLDKKSTLSQEDWSRLADMKIAKFKNSPKVEDDDRSDNDILDWLDDKESVDEIEAALRYAGREDEITPFRKSILGRFGDEEGMAEALLSDGLTKEAEAWFEKDIEQNRGSATSHARMREFAISRGELLKAAAFDAEAFFDNPSIDRYDQLMAICSVGGAADAVRKAVFRALESGIRPDFEETKGTDWPLPIVALGRHIDEELKPSFELLAELAWREHRPEEALSYYKRATAQRHKNVLIKVNEFDWRMADRIALIWPEEAMAIWEWIIANSASAWQSDYDNIDRALRCMKPIFFVNGKAKAFREKVRDLIAKNKKRRNLVEMLEKILSGRDCI